MTDYIDRDALLRKIRWADTPEECLVDERTAERFRTFCLLADAVEQMPAVDAVPVVRCRDCVYAKNAKVTGRGFLICPASHMEIKDDDFCSYGEQSEDDNG